MFLYGSQQGLLLISQFSLDAQKQGWDGEACKVSGVTSLVLKTVPMLDMIPSK